MSETSVRLGLETPVWLDINNGMNRTGIEPGEEALKLFRMLCDLPGIIPAGLHVYDGHIHEKDHDARHRICNAAYSKIELFISRIEKFTESPVKVVAGGSPTFPVHARRINVETSPGTTLLWDQGYASAYADMNFINAAVLFTRIVSKPSENSICFDLGTKAVASEMPQPRVKFTDLEDYRIIGHNEEHMVVETNEAKKLKIGDHFYAIPWHICPTVDRYDSVYVSKDGRVVDQWNVEARKRRITI